jgi:dTDP-4-amino-4,6-dideoxygalactose transaminase
MGAEAIPVFTSQVRADALHDVADSLGDGWLGMGAATKEFEECIAAFLQLSQRYVCATNTGTSALHLGLLAAEVGNGDEVIAPSFTYVADHQAIAQTGADIVMCDIREDNLGIDCAAAEQLVTPRTKAILPLHYAGLPCDHARVYELADEHGLRVIEDACNAFGSTINGKPIGSFGDIACFSFDAVKIVTSVDGGCVIVNSEQERDRLRRLRFLGIDNDIVERYKNARSWNYDVVDAGFRYHLTNLFASIGIAQLAHAAEYIASRQVVCKRYSDAFAALRGVRVLRRDYSDVSPFIYSLRILDGRRSDLIEFLKLRNIATGIHFLPAHRFSQFAACRRGDMTVTDRVAPQILTLPLHSNMKPSFAERVIEAICEFFQ